MTPSTFVAFFHDVLNAYNKMCEPILHEFDIPQVSFDILMFLNNNPELSTAQQISEFRKIKKNLVSVHVDKLVTAGAELTYNVPHWKFGVEYTLSSAWYGKLDKSDGKIIDTHSVSNNRIVAVAMFMF